MSDREREASQEAFIHDHVLIMVATNAFGMGIDKSNVRYVLHYNMPKNMEAYYQEAGRAGRDGDPGECILLFGAQDVLLQKFMIRETVYSPHRKKNEYHKLQTIVDYCHTTRCLRRYILEYFGEDDAPAQCGRCGNCSTDCEMNDITVEAQKILSCVVRVRGRYGAGLIAEILKGSKNKKVQQLRFDRLSTYGLMSEYTLQGIKDLINLLAAEGYLAFTGGEYPVLKLGRKAAAVLKGSEKVWQRRPKKREARKDSLLFEKMRLLRKQIAAREGVPPYIVFPDSTLHELCEWLPQDRDSMLKIKGVGQIKMERFGEEFLRVIREHR
ncbi:MAG: RQC domain-containing protein [Dethiobacteria bacterium]